MNRRETRRALKAAVNLLNDGGRHWIKGRLRSYNGQGEPAFCSIGGINEATEKCPLRVREDATITLARAIAPGQVDQAERAAARHAYLLDRPWKKATQTEKNEYIRREVVSASQGIIINMNDAPSTKWARVRRTFDKAIASLS